MFYLYKPIPRGGALFGDYLNKLGRGQLGDATNQISRSRPYVTPWVEIEIR